MKEMPTDAKGYATTAASIVMDMLPIGKVLKVVKGPAGKVLMQQVEKQVLKQAEKRALKMATKVGVKTEEMKLLPQFTATALDKATSLIMHQKEFHLFEGILHPKPYLDQLANQMKGRKNFIRTVLDNINGKLPKEGLFELPVNINGTNLTVRGIIHNGYPIINTMYKP